MASDSRGYKLGVAVTDTHGKDHDPALWAGICAYMADIRVDYLLHLGDLLNLDGISRFAEDVPEYRMSWPVAEEAALGRGLLDKALAAARRKNKDCKAVLIQGNHEARLDKYVLHHPELKGLLDTEALLGLKQRKVKYVPFDNTGEVYKIGNAAFIHGRYLNKYHPFTHADKYCLKIYYGHTHDMMRFTKPKWDLGDVDSGQSLGCTCKLKLDYRKGLPDNWEQGFGVFFFYPNGTHCCLPVVVVKGRFVGPTNGKLYDCKKILRAGHATRR